MAQDRAHTFGAYAQVLVCPRVCRPLTRCALHLPVPSRRRLGTPNLSDQRGAPGQHSMRKRKAPNPKPGA